LEQVKRLQPDVLVLDINLPELSGTQVTEQLRDMPKPVLIAPDRLWPPSILILSAYIEREYVFNLFASGAEGYLLKDESPERIAQGIRQVFRGEPALSISVQKMLLFRKLEFQHDLSERELEVLRLMAKGNTNEEIADVLFITIGTVKNHVTNIYKKLPSVRTRSEAVAWAWQNRIVEVD
jgi:DNA-binding NarL/FixJ family response regulator